jgi:phospholipase/lecithinase/hemolysin
MPDVTMTPGYKAYAPFPSFFVAEEVVHESPEEIRKRIRKFNDKLARALGKIKAKNPKVSIYRFDTFALLNDIIANPEDYGVNSNPAIPLLNEEALFINGELVLQNDPGALFWDGVHPASNAHAVFAEAACRLLDKPHVVCEG